MINLTKELKVLVSLEYPLPKLEKLWQRTHLHKSVSSNRISDCHLHLLVANTPNLTELMIGKLRFQLRHQVELGGGSRRSVPKAANAQCIVAMARPILTMPQDAHHHYRGSYCQICSQSIIPRFVELWSD